MVSACWRSLASSARPPGSVPTQSRLAAGSTKNVPVTSWPAELTWRRAVPSTQAWSGAAAIGYDGLTNTKAASVLQPEVDRHGVAAKSLVHPSWYQPLPDLTQPETSVLPSSQTASPG